MWILLIIAAIIIIKEAFQEYRAEKYANRKVYNKDTDFFDFMFLNHPYIIIGGIVFIILCIIGIFTMD